MVEHGETWWIMVKTSYFTLFHPASPFFTISPPKKKQGFWLPPICSPFWLESLAVKLFRVPLWEGCLESSSFGASGKGLSQQEMPKAMKAMKAMKSSSSKAMKAVKKPLQKGKKQWNHHLPEVPRLHPWRRATWKSCANSPPRTKLKRLLKSKKMRWKQPWSWGMKWLLLKKIAHGKSMQHTWKWLGLRRKKWVWGKLQKGTGFQDCTVPHEDRGCQILFRLQADQSREFPLQKRRSGLVRSKPSTNGDKQTWTNT